MVVRPAAETSYDDAVLAAASETSRWPLLSKSNPKGTAPAEGSETNDTGRPAPSRSMTSTRLVFFSVTTSSAPSGVTETCAGPVASPLSWLLPPVSGVRAPSVTANDVTLPAPPAFIAYSRSPWTATLIGVLPPEATVPIRASPPEVIRNDVTVLDPASTA